MIFVFLCRERIQRICDADFLMHKRIRDHSVEEVRRLNALNFKEEVHLFTIKPLEEIQREAKISFTIARDKLKLQQESQKYGKIHPIYPALIEEIKAEEARKAERKSSNKYSSLYGKKKEHDQPASMNDNNAKRVSVTMSEADVSLFSRRTNKSVSLSIVPDFKNDEFATDSRIAPFASRPSSAIPQQLDQSAPEELNVERPSTEHLLKRNNTDRSLFETNIVEHHDKSFDTPSTRPTSSRNNNKASNLKSDGKAQNKLQHKEELLRQKEEALRKKLQEREELNQLRHEQRELSERQKNWITVIYLLARLKVMNSCVRQYRHEKKYNSQSILLHRAASKIRHWWLKWIVIRKFRRYPKCVDIFRRKFILFNLRTNLKKKKKAAGLIQVSLLVHIKYFYQH